MSFLKDLIQETKNEFATVASDGVPGADVVGHVDTGSYAFNALLSGSIYGGIPSNKITALAGESATGKTFFALGMCKKFLDDNPEGMVLYFDSESAVSSKMMAERGIDTSRVAVFPVSTVEGFRFQVLQILSTYTKLPKKDKHPMIIVLDSLGMLSTEKEVTDTEEGKTTRDMTRAQMVGSTFRVLTLKLGQVGIPLIVTNHTYDSIGGLYPTKIMSGGTKLVYAASTVVFLSKKKVREGTDVIGNIIHCKLQKSRLTKENSMVDVMLNYDTGLDPYYGLVDLALKHGIFKKVSTRIELPDGTKVFEKVMYKTPEKYFTPEIMEKIDHAASLEFLYGMATEEKEDGGEPGDDSIHGGE